MENVPKKIIAVVVLAVVVLVVLVAYFATGSSGGMFLLFTIVNIILIVTLAVFINMAIRESKRKGLPRDDEMLRTMKYKAGYYAFIAVIYMVLIMMILNVVIDESSPYHITLDMVLPFLSIAPAVIFFILMMYYGFRGIRE